MEKKVSVIIPFYNNINWLNEAVESVLNQTYQNIEIIVVNDGSFENINMFLESYREKIFYFEKTNGGAASARNLGISHANGEFIAFLDSDDIWLPNKLQEQISFMENNNYFWSHTDYFSFNDGGIKEKYVKCALKDKIIPMCLVWNPIATPSVVINSDILKNNPNFSFAEWRNVGEDSYLWLNLGKYFPLGYIPKGLIKVRMRGTNTSKQALLQMKYRGETHDEIKSYKSEFKYVFLYYLLRASTLYCKKMYPNIMKFAKAHNFNKIQIEFIARFAYLLPYIVFRILRLIL